MMDFMNNETDQEKRQSSSLNHVLAEQDAEIKVDQVDEDFEGSDESEYLTTSVGNSNVKRNTMILAAIFAIGAGALLLMIKNATPQQASAAQMAKPNNEIELAIAKLSGIKAEIFNKMDGIAKKFDEFSNVEQINVGQLKRNPFRFQFSGNLRGSISSNRNVKNTTGFFVLDSVIESEDGNFCMIDGQVYNEGDTVSGYEVKKVGRDFVRLEAQGDVKILKISMP